MQLNCKHLELVDQLIYLGYNILSTESNVTIILCKVIISIIKLNTIEQSDLSNRIKREFFRFVAVSVLFYGQTIWTLAKCLERKKN